MAALLAQECTAALGEATAAARRTLVGYLQAASVKLLTRIEEPGGPDWEIIHKVTPEALGVRADRALGDLLAEIEKAFPPERNHHEP
jgi:hypothetical protein